MSTSTPRIALVTARPARSLDEDLPPLQRLLAAAGADVAVVDWDDPQVDWSRFDLTILRSTWDYSGRLPEFLTWAEATAAKTRLHNPLPVVRWNTDKHYLAELARAGVAVVPSTFIEPGEDAGSRLAGFLATLPGDGEFVVKPAIGAGSRDAQRYLNGGTDPAQAAAHVRRLLDARRSVLLQPYLGRVDQHGETSLIYIDGVPSHAIRKGPLLHRGTAPTRALFAPEHISRRTPSADELAAADAVLAALPFPGSGAGARPLLYARVDLLHDAADRPCLLELELTEPSLFLALGDGAGKRLAQAVLRRL